MKKPIAIIAGEPNSISSEIIFKSWVSRKKYPHKPFFVIGNLQLLNLQKKKLKYKIKIKKIEKNFKIKDLAGKSLPVLNIRYNQSKPFQELSNKSNRYIFECFRTAIKFVKDKKIIGFVNCPVSKEILFKNKNMGVTEFISKKDGNFGNEVMLIFNKKLSVSPLTTHIPLKQVSKKINKIKIIKKIKIINSFYKKIFNRKPNIAVLGFNPHNFSSLKKSEEKEEIIPAIKKIRSIGINVNGPVSPDTSFTIFQKYKFDIIFGMYHDQVLGPFKALFKYDAINITSGLSYIRVSPDHGIGKDIVGKNIANPKSLIKSIQFFNYINS